MMEIQEEKRVPGLPMGLAETRKKASSHQCFFIRILQKILAVVLLLVFIAAVYILVLKFLGVDETICKTEIIVVSTDKKPSNVTFSPDSYNSNGLSIKIRNKRNTYGSAKYKSKVAKIEKVKKVVSEYDFLCNDEAHKETCREVLSKLKTIVENNSKNKNAIKFKHVPKKFNKYDERQGDLIKRETVADIIPAPFERSPNTLQAYPDLNIPPLTDNCLLNRLMRQSGQHFYGYEHMKPEFDPDLLTYPRQVPLHFLPPYGQRPDLEPRKYTPHPQDIEIALMSKQLPGNFFPSYTQEHHEDMQIKQHPQDIDTVLNVKSNCKPPLTKDNTNTECPVDTLPCDNGDCVSANLWCDGNVDCSDVSDEYRCSCRDRVDKSRVCDGYFDCPFGEDEMGCFGCRDNTFSCEDQMSGRSTCFTKEQRCNNIADCPNRKDELDCTMLAPSLHKKPLFAVSNTEGFLHRNFKGTWYAVCNNPYMWAHDACRRETGLIIRPPFIQFMEIDPMIKVNYLNTAPGGLIHNSTSCFNSSAVYVTCPDLLCGTRILTSSQLIRENEENQLFGRNKRFLIPNHPYRFLFYGPYRDKRSVASDVASREISSEDSRKKRTESRVVGGKPSQPAAWPWVVALYRDGLFHCGGVIVNQNWIMSAAHCVHNYWKHYYEVQVGMLRRFSFSPQEENLRVTHVIVNQNYDQHNMRNDLSLLRVKPAIQFSRWVRPICLPGPEVAGPDWMWGPPVGTICTAVGWGSTVEHGPDPDHLREVELPIWEHCNHEEDQAGKEICAGLVEGGRDTCQGDSGGPLLCQNPANDKQWYVAGIVSHGDGCARKGQPGVYTRVSLLLSWIKHHISSKNLPVIQPKQECPGFRCNSGISKCLPKNRLYDKIIDCLDGEDEINCDTKESSNILDEILSLPFGRKANESDLKTVIPKDESSSSKLSDITQTTQKEVPVTNLPETTTVKLITTTKILNKNQEVLSTSTVMVKNYEEDKKTQTTTAEPDSSMETEGNSFEGEDSTDDPYKITTTDISYTQNMPLPTTHIKGESMIAEKKPDISNQNPATTTILYVTSSIVTTEKNIILDATESDTNQAPSVIKIEKLPEYTSTESGLYTTDSSTITDSITIIPTTEISSHLHSTDTTIPEEQDDIINVIEAIRYKTKHKTPLLFQCRKLAQVVPYKHRCDHKADCEDGTDELDCTCLDYLTTFDNELICDGNFNCPNGEDEIDCFGCDEEQFLCKRSQMCLPNKYVCDGKPQCPLGEDEFDCLALTNGADIRFDLDGRPKVRFEGFVTRKHNNDWQVICEENMSIHDQEEAAVHICRYLGFSNANSYKIKYINVKDNNLIELPPDVRRSKRNKSNKEPVKFTYTKYDTIKKESRSAEIREPEVLKEMCLPNVTKTCMTLYVLCEQSLYTNFDDTRNLLFSRSADDDYSQDWPWIAKLYSDGYYKCTGVLIDVSWVLFNNECLNLNLETPHYNTVILGSHKTLFSTKSLYERVFKVDAIKDLYNSKVILLHLERPAEYSTMVKPMIPPTIFNISNSDRSICVAVGQDATNNTVSILLRENREGCPGDNVCFDRLSTVDPCPNGFSVSREWAGIISCHSKQGWYPAATFVDPQGECNVDNRLFATEIGNLKYEKKYYDERPILPSNELEELECEGARCERGRCVKMRQVCDGVRHCEDGADEAPDTCKRKHNFCSKDSLNRGCECPAGQLKCRNGQCIPKELFKNGRYDCSDGTDEPGQTTCSDYLSMVEPSRLCDGVLHCHDKSDENPMFCKCFAKNAYRCGRDTSSEDYCVALDMVCDGIPDCPNGEDERTCIALSARQGTRPGIGEVIIRSHGVWYSKCYPKPTHLKSELEDICREVGFISGHAKQLPTPQKSHPYNNVVKDEFSDVMINNNTKIKLRNSQAPFAHGTLEAITNCYPLFIECL